MWNGSDSNNKITLHVSNALPFVFVICCGCNCIVTHRLWEPWSWVGIWVLRYIVIRLRDWACCKCRKPTTRQEGLHLLQLEPGVVKRQYLFLREICTYLHWPCARYYTSLHRMLLLVASHTTLVIKVEPNLITYIVGRLDFFNFVNWSRSAMLVKLVPTLALHKVHVLACIAQHLFR